MGGLHAVASVYTKRNGNCLEVEIVYFSHGDVIQSVGAVEHQTLDGQRFG